MSSLDVYGRVFFSRKNEKRYGGDWVKRKFGVRERDRRLATGYGGTVRFEGPGRILLQKAIPGSSRDAYHLDRFFARVGRVRARFCHISSGVL